MYTKKRVNNINCCVYGCHSKKGREEHLSFHSFPSKNAGYVTIENKFGLKEKICKREAWKRTVLMGKPIGCFMKVCSMHFLQDDFISPDFRNKRAILKKTAVPSQNLPQRSIQDTIPNSSLERRNRYQRKMNESGQKNKENENPDSVNQESSACSPHHTIQKRIMSDLDKKEKQAVLNILDPKDVFVKTKQDKSVQVKSGDIVVPFVKNIIDSEAKLNSLTGLDSFNMLSILTYILDKYFPQERTGKLSTKDCVVLTFMKMKTGMRYVLLAALFNLVESKTCKIVFHDTISKLAILLQPAIPFPDLEECQRNLPASFKNFPNVRIVLDCIELSLEKPKRLCCRIETYSPNKGGQTIKFMTGVTPAGLINFVSKAYGGRASDKEIFEQSGLIDKLDMGKDAVMVNKGFCIDEITSAHHIELIQPPFLRSKKQFSEEESQKAVEIAQACVHLERTYQRIRIFEIFKKPLPLTLVPIIDDIFNVACAIVNLSRPILSDVRY